LSGAIAPVGRFDAAFLVRDDVLLAEIVPKSQRETPDHFQISAAAINSKLMGVKPVVIAGFAPIADATTPPPLPMGVKPVVIAGFAPIGAMGAAQRAKSRPHEGPAFATAIY
jgi:hypothetical protein